MFWAIFKASGDSNQLHSGIQKVIGIRSSSGISFLTISASTDYVDVDIIVTNHDSSKNHRI